MQQGDHNDREGEACGTVIALFSYQTLPANRLFLKSSTVSADNDPRDEPVTVRSLLCLSFSFCRLVKGPSCMVVSEHLSRSSAMRRLGDTECVRIERAICMRTSCGEKKEGRGGGRKNTEAMRGM